MKQVIEELDSLKIEIENKSDRLNDPNGVLDCIEYMSSLFDDTLKELARLVDDLPRGVKDKHILMAKEIHKN